MRRLIILIVSVLFLNFTLAFAQNDDAWFIAIESGNLEIVELLIEGRADVNAVDNDMDGLHCFLLHVLGTPKLLNY